MFWAQMPPMPEHRRPHLPGWAVAAMLLFAGTPAAAQIPGLPPGAHPSPQEVQTLLETRPDLVAQLQQRIAESGLTPEQIRARLRAAGYPEDLLDAYIGGATDTTQALPPPTTSQLGAFGALGLLTVSSDTLGQIDSLGMLAAPEQLRRADSLRADSLADSSRVRGQLKRFGTDVFRRATTRFQTLQSGPVDRWC